MKHGSMMKHIVTAAAKGVGKRNPTVGGTRRRFPLMAKRARNGAK